jgi:hypothetical protein
VHGILRVHLPDDTGVIVGGQYTYQVTLTYARTIHLPADTEGSTLSHAKNVRSRGAVLEASHNTRRVSKQASGALVFDMIRVSLMITRLQRVTC